MQPSEGTVFVVDDESDVRRALLRLLAASGHRARAFASSEVFLNDVGAEEPGCLVLDVRMPKLDGMEVQRALAGSPECRPIIFLTGYPTVADSVAAMKAGAIDFLTKPVDDALLLRAIGHALRKDAADRNARRLQREACERVEQLTCRERQVMEQLIRGRLNKQVAADMGIVEKTVKVHRHRVLEKMGVRTVVELWPVACDANFAVSPALAARMPVEKSPEQSEGVGTDGDPLARCRPATGAQGNGSTVIPGLAESRRRRPWGSASPS